MSDKQQQHCNKDDDNRLLINNDENNNNIVHLGQQQNLEEEKKNKPFDEVRTDENVRSLQTDIIIINNQQLSNTIQELEKKVQYLQKENDQNQQLILKLQGELASLRKEHHGTIDSYQRRLQEAAAHSNNKSKRNYQSESQQQQQQQQSNNSTKSKKQRTIKRTTKKALFQSWGQQLIQDSARHKIINGTGEDSYSIVIKEHNWTMENWDAIFGPNASGQEEHATAIKRCDSKSSKPTTASLSLSTKSQVQNLFGDAIIPPQDERGGYYKVKAFRKQKGSFRSQQVGTWDSLLDSLDVQLNKQGCLQLTFYMITIRDSLKIGQL